MVESKETANSPKNVPEGDPPEEAANKSGEEAAENTELASTTASENEQEEMESEEEELTLAEKRDLAVKLRTEETRKLKEGDQVVAVPKSWLATFLHEDKEVPLLSSESILDDTQLVLSGEFEFVPERLFHLLCEWYGWDAAFPVVRREVFFNTAKNQLDVDTWPLYVVPHVLSANAATINRYRTSTQQAKPFLVSARSTARHLKLKIEKMFGVAPHSRTRLWQIALKDSHLSSLPLIIVPSYLETVSERRLIRAGKKYGHRTLQEGHVSSGHVMLELQQPDGTYLIDTASELELDDGRVGLNNLGNTCYMNSALQCLVHIPELTYYFLYDFYKKEINKENPLGNHGKVADAYGMLAKHLFDKRVVGQQTAFAPREFRYTIGYLNSIFSDYRQQDSQEFIAFLLDGLHEDLNRVLQKPYVEKPELPEGKVDDQEAIQTLAAQCWDAHKKRNDSVIIDLFVGQYKSTLHCPVCSHVSITFDPYNDLTLPLPITRKWRHKVSLLPASGPPRSLALEMDRSATYQQLKEEVAKEAGISVADVVGVEVFQSQVYKNYEDAESDTRYLPVAELISKGDDVWFYELHREPGDVVVPVYSTVSGSGALARPRIFGIPFLVVLKPEETASYGAIRVKLEQRYTQLSTYKYFEKIRLQGKPHYEAGDFPALDANLKQQLEQCSDAASVISLASPELPGDCGFHVKLLEESRAKLTQRGFGQGISLYDTSSDEEEEKPEQKSGIWFPDTNGDFSGLKDMLERLDPLKAALYSYHGVEEVEEVEEVEKAEHSVHSIPDESPAPEVHDIPDTPPVQPSVSDADDEDEMMDAEDEVIVISSGEESKATKEEESGKKVLLPPKTALVCEWDSELFDAFFTGLEDEEDGGKETWTSPTPLVEASKTAEPVEPKKTLDLDDCLQMFSRPEVLGERDLWYCPHCKEHRQATKKIEVWSVPDILTIHLKRFESSRSFSDKIDATVEFPIEGLDMAQYVVGSQEKGLVYDLYAVDNHYGGMGGGHYTAYVKNFVDSKWYYYDDSHVSAADPVQSIRGSAYLLFYRRRSSEPLGGEFFRQMEDEIARHRAEHLEKIKRLSALEEESTEEKVETEPEDASLAEDVKRRKVGPVSMGRSPSEMVLDSPQSDREEVMSTISSSANAPVDEEVSDN